jgi:hypothetical protein
MQASASVTSLVALIPCKNPLAKSFLETIGFNADVRQIKTDSKMIIFISNFFYLLIVTPKSIRFIYKYISNYLLNNILQKIIKPIH